MEGQRAYPCCRGAARLGAPAAGPPCCRRRRQQQRTRHQHAAPAAALLQHALRVSKCVGGRDAKQPLCLLHAPGEGSMGWAGQRASCTARVLLPAPPASATGSTSREAEGVFHASHPPHPSLSECGPSGCTAAPLPWPPPRHPRTRGASSRQSPPWCGRPAGVGVRSEGKEGGKAWVAAIECKRSCSAARRRSSTHLARRRHRRAHGVGGGACRQPKRARHKRVSLLRRSRHREVQDCIERAAGMPAACASINRRRWQPRGLPACVAPARPPAPPRGAVQHPEPTLILWRGRAAGSR